MKRNENNSNYEPNQQEGTPNQMYGNYPQATEKTKNTLSIIGLILAVASIMCCVIGPVLAIPGIVLCIVAIMKHEKKGLAITGIVTGVISCIIYAILLFIGLQGEGQGITYSFVNNLDSDTEDKQDAAGSIIDSIELGDGVELITEEECEDKAESDFNIDNTQKPSSINAALDMGELSYNGTIINIGDITVSDFSALIGCAFDEEDMTWILNPGQLNTICAFPFEYNDKICITVICENKTNEVADTSQCTVIGVAIETSDYFSGDCLSDLVKVEVCNGLSESANLEEVLSTLGEPDYRYDSEDYPITAISYYSSDGYDYELEYNFMDGECTEITVYNRS